MSGTFIPRPKDRRARVKSTKGVLVVLQDDDIAHNC